MKKLISFIVLIMLAFFVNSCLFLLEDPIDPKLKKERDAYYTLIEAHAQKQIWMYNFFKTYSNNYSSGELFIYEPTQTELDIFLSDLAYLMTYSNDIDSAIVIIHDAQNGISTDQNYAKLKSVNGLIDSMAAFYKWGRNAGKRARERTLLILSNMNEMEKTQLYNELLRDNWKNEYPNEKDFWTKLQNGELDDKSPQIYNDFYYNSSYTENNNFFVHADNKGLTPGKIVAKEGAEGIKNGAAVYVEAGKIITGTSAGVDLVENSVKWYEKAEKAVDKPIEFVKDEIKERLAKKLAGFIDIDGVVDGVGLGETTGNIAKGLMELSFGTNDPAEIIQKGFDWGIARVSSTSKTTTPEVIMAEKENNDYSFPEIILGVGNYVNNLGETLIALPRGNWNITVVDKKGNSDKENAVNINKGLYSEVSVTLIPETINESDTDSIDTTVQKIDFPQYNYCLIGINGQCGIFNLGNQHKVDDLENIKISWSGNSFQANYDYKKVSETDHNYFGSLSGTLSMNDKNELVVTITASETESWPWGGFYELKKQIKFTEVPQDRTYPNNFYIDGSISQELKSNLGNYISYNYESTYSLGGVVVQDDPATCSSSTVDENSSAYVMFRN